MNSFGRENAIVAVPFVLVALPSVDVPVPIVGVPVHVDNEASLVSRIVRTTARRILSGLNLI